VNAKNGEGMTPLYYALINVGPGTQGYEKIIQIADILVEKGADIHAVMRDGSTVLFLSVGQFDLAMAEKFLTKGADVHLKNNDDWTALTLAAYQGNAVAVKYLLDKGADPNAKTNKRQHLSSLP
jgi:ankyrin repeat protein